MVGNAHRCVAQRGSTRYGPLRGFQWLTWGSFFLGLAKSYGYGWYFALIWVPLYNYFALHHRGEIETS